MRNDLLDQHRTLSKNEKCCIHCRKLSMPWMAIDRWHQLHYITEVLLISTPSNSTLGLRLGEWLNKWLEFEFSILTNLKDSVWVHIPLK